MPYQWTQAFLGGALIGLAALIPLFFLGRIAGISGITFTALSEKGSERTWRLAFLAGLLSGGALLQFTHPEVFRGVPTLPLALISLAGLLVGFGVSLGSGCTSGHGVCGVSRLSPRSLAATTIFLALGMASATLLHGVSL